MTGTTPGSPKLICTGRGSHRRRTLGVYVLRDEGFSLLQHAPRGQDPVHITWPPLQPASSEKAKDPTIELMCLSCGEGRKPRNMRFKASDLDKFLRADTGSIHKDASSLSAILSKHRQAN